MSLIEEREFTTNLISEIQFNGEFIEYKRKDSGKRKDSNKTRLNSIRNSMKRILSNKSIKSIKSRKSSSENQL